MKNEMMIKKIFLLEFIDILIDLYEKGADYIDLGGTTYKGRDELRIDIKDDYLREDSLTDDLLNKLTNG
jgi:hypothetical protein